MRVRLTTHEPLTIMISSFIHQESAMARSPGNAVKEETFEGMGGLKIFLRSWKPVSKPRGVIVICHGVNSHGGLYISVGEQFAASGFATYALDLRSRGKSEGPRFFVNQINEYVSDVSNTIKLARARDPGLPVFLLGTAPGGWCPAPTRSTTKRRSQDLFARVSPSRCRPPISP